MRATAPSPLKRTAGAIAVFLLLAVVGGQTAVADTKSELASAKAKLHKLEDQISTNQSKLNALRDEATALVTQLDKVQSALAQREAEIARLTHEIEQANEELGGLQGQLDHRAWVAYEGGPGSTFEFLLSSTSLADLSTRLEIVNRAAQSDRELINQVQDKRADLQTKELAQRQAKARLISQEGDLQKQNEVVQAKLDEVGAVAATLHGQQAAAESLVSKLDAKVKAEEAAKLAALQGSGGGGGAVSGSPFQRCPVPGAVYSDDFGAPRYSGGYHAHAGNDMFASRGTPIYAPFSGTAADASNGLGGTSVKVFGAAGWVYNAHLNSIGRLGSVSAGTVIGYVGDSGDALGGPTHDHFEWHPNVIPANAWTSPYGVSQVGSAIDPYPYLNQVC